MKGKVNRKPVLVILCSGEAISEVSIALLKLYGGEHYGQLWPH